MQKIFLVSCSLIVFICSHSLSAVLVGMDIFQDKQGRHIYLLYEEHRDDLSVIDRIQYETLKQVLKTTLTRLHFLVEVPNLFCQLFNHSPKATYDILPFIQNNCNALVSGEDIDIRNKASIAKSLLTHNFTIPLKELLEKDDFFTKELPFKSGPKKIYELTLAEVFEEWQETIAQLGKYEILSSFIKKQKEQSWIEIVRNFLKLFNTAYPDAKVKESDSIIEIAFKLHNKSLKLQEENHTIENCQEALIHFIETMSCHLINENIIQTIIHFNKPASIVLIAGGYHIIVVRELLLQLGYQLLPTPEGTSNPFLTDQDIPILERFLKDKHLQLLGTL